MPWTAAEFKDRHWKKATPAQARQAARVANALLKRGESEGTAIAVAIKQAKKRGK